LEKFIEIATGDDFEGPAKITGVLK